MTPIEEQDLKDRLDQVEQDFNDLRAWVEQKLNPYGVNVYIDSDHLLTGNVTAAHLSTTPTYVELKDVHGQTVQRIRTN